MTDIQSGIRVEPAAGSLGAYVFGIDLSRPMDAGQMKQLRDLLLTYHVVCFREQDLTPAQHVSFTRSLGDFYIHPVVKGLEGHPEIVEVFGAARQTEAWHQDASHSEQPPRLSILAARRLPPFGNDTQFSNQHKAYDALSDGLKSMLANVRAVHTTGEPTKRALDQASGNGPVFEEASHPVIRTHPETGKKALYVNAMYTRRFDGMTVEESRGLLEFLYLHCGRSDFTFRHRWQSGDVLIWDNASVQHAVVGDMPEGTDRYLHRTTTAGKIPA